MRFIHSSVLFDISFRNGLRKICHHEACACVLGPELQTEHVTPHPRQEGLLVCPYANGSLVILVAFEQSPLNKSPRSVAPTDAKILAVLHSIVIRACTDVSYRVPEWDPEPDDGHESKLTLDSLL